MEPQSRQLEPLAVSSVADETNDEQANPTVFLRCAWVLAGVILPLICFAISYPNQPIWQSGEVEDYAALLMSHEASLPLYPLLVGSMIGLAFLAVQPARFAKNGWVRLGIFSGVVLAVEYWFVFQAAMGDMVGMWFAKLFAALFLSALAIAVPYSGGRVIIFGISRLSPTFKVVAVAVLGIILLMSFPYAAILSLFCSTPWALAAYGSAAVWLIRRRKPPYLRYTLAQLLTAVTLLAVNFAAWRTAFQLVLVKYASLPPQPPSSDCYVCSAAARGHRWIVRSATRLGDDGTAYIANDQLRTLKAFELLIVAVSPALHRAMRRIYDRVGPPLAAALANPLAADVAYFALKPLEWLARGVLRLVLGRHAALIDRLYRV
jgi:hypothetical protein